MTSLNRDRRIVIGAILAATLFRLFYALVVNTPFSGPDADTYSKAAAAFADHGLLAGSPGLPEWPAGYPLLLTPFYVVAGDGARLAMAFQVISVSIGTYFAWTLVRRELGETIAMITAIALCLSPALTAASGELMYETPLAAALVMGMDLLSRSFRAEGRRAILLAAASGVVLGIAACMQPKVLLAAVVVLAFAGWRTGSKALPVAGLVALALAPVGLATRSAAAEGQFALSANLGATLRVGLHHRLPRHCYFPPANEFAADRVKRDCVIDYELDHPSVIVPTLVGHAADFWVPMTGPLTERGTWFHAFDPRRLVPSSVKNSSGFHSFDRAASWLWTLGVVGLVLAGLLLGVRDRRYRTGTIFLALPVLSFFLVSVLVEGDARFRLPVSPFYIALQAVACAAIGNRVLSGPCTRRRSEPSSVPAESRLRPG